eukprot:jgi/Mesvir1/28070/Mv04663-RA.1
MLGIVSSVHIHLRAGAAPHEFPFSLKEAIANTFAGCTRDVRGGIPKHDLLAALITIYEEVKETSPSSHKWLLSIRRPTATNVEKALKLEPFCSAPSLNYNQFEAFAHTVARQLVNQCVIKVSVGSVVGCVLVSKGKGLIRKIPKIGHVAAPVVGAICPTLVGGLWIGFELAKHFK